MAEGSVIRRAFYKLPRTIFSLLRCATIYRLPYFGIVRREHQRYARIRPRQQHCCRLGIRSRPSTTAAVAHSNARAGGATGEMSSVTLAEKGELAELGGIALVLRAPSEPLLTFALVCLQLPSGFRFSVLLEVP